MSYLYSVNCKQITYYDNDFKYIKNFSEVSPWQLVEVFSVPDFGNMLVIDGDVNLAGNK